MIGTARGKRVGNAVLPPSNQATNAQHSLRSIFFNTVGCLNQAAATSLLL